MVDSTKIAIRASTQAHLEIEDIKEGIVILKGGGCCLIIVTTAINFDLLSEKEQEATIFAYAALLNSLAFPIQIVIRSQRKDISSYLKLLEEAEAKETKNLIKEQIVKYRQFVTETVQKNNVLDKKCYLVIPMSALELGISKAFDKNYILQKAKISLYPKRDHFLRQLNRLGLKGRQLNSQELIRLFFEIYNPESRGQQVGEARQYQAPLVQPSLPGQNIQEQISGLVKESIK